MAVAEEVDPRSGRGARDERALRAELSRARSSERDEVADGACAALLREPHERDQDLRGRERVRQRPVARLDRDAEEVRELPERDTLAPSRQQPPREPDRIEHRSRAAAAGELLDGTVEEADVEAGVVRDEWNVPGELEKATEGELDPWRAAQLLLPDPGQRGDEPWQHRPGVDECLEGLHDLERANADGPDLADAAGSRGEAGRLQVEDDELGLLERRVRVRVAGEPHARADEREARVSVDHVAQQRARQRDGRSLEREEHSSCLLGGNRPVLGLDELDQPVRGVERKLHRSSVYEHTFWYKRGASSRMSRPPTSVTRPSVRCPTLGVAAQNDEGAALPGGRRPRRNLASRPPSRPPSRP